MPDIHLLSEKSISDLKLKAKRLSKSKSISLSRALQEVANSIGFPSWKDLIHTYKFETNQRDYNAHIKNDLSALEPFENEVSALRISMIKSKGIDIETYEKLINPTRLFSLTSDESEKFESLHEEILSIDRSSEAEIAKKYGFSSWSELRKKHIRQLLIQKYTDEQKIGAIARKIGINPKHIKHTIHVAIDINNDELLGLEKNEWEKIGFLKDIKLSNWISQNDSYFYESNMEFFRVISIDSPSFSEVENFLQDTNEKLDTFFPIFASCVWINGKTDPQYLIPEDDYPEQYLPLPQIPTEIWKKGY